MLSLEKVHRSCTFPLTDVLLIHSAHLIAKGITVTASPAVLFNELAIVANLLDDDGRIVLLFLLLHDIYYSHV